MKFKLSSNKHAKYGHVIFKDGVLDVSSHGYLYFSPFWVIEAYSISYNQLVYFPTTIWYIHYNEIWGLINVYNVK